MGESLLLSLEVCFDGSNRSRYFVKRSGEARWVMWVQLG